MKRAWYLKQIIHSLKTITTWNILMTYPCYEVHYQDELALHLTWKPKIKIKVLGNLSNYTKTWMRGLYLVMNIDHLDSILYDLIYHEY